MPVILNRPNLLHLNGFTRVQRLTSVACLRDAIVSSHGWVTDFHEFSNLSICLQFEIPIEHLPLLAESLLAAGVKFNARSESISTASAPRWPPARSSARCRSCSSTTSPICAARFLPSQANEPGSARRVLAEGVAVSRPEPVRPMAVRAGSARR